MTVVLRRSWHMLFQRERAMGLFFLLLGLAIILIFGPSAESGERATLVLNLGGLEAVAIPDLVLPVRESIYFLGLIALFLAGLQIIRATKATNLILGGILLIAVLAFLTWSARGKSLNFTGVLSHTLIRATPIALGALSGIWCERSAVINIAIEGMMLSGAFVAVVVASITGNLYLGVVGALLAGALLAALLAVLSIRFKVDQIVSGTVINIFAAGATSFLTARILVKNQALNTSGTFQPIAIPLLSRIPILGPVFFNNNFIIYSMLILVVLTHLILFYTRWGLRSRAVGEHPLAADTLGINVLRTRYINVIIGGMIAGLGGTYFTLGSAGRFDELMTAGKGFIGLAAMIFGKWTPFGGFASSLIFGFADSLQVKLGILGVNIPYTAEPLPSEILLMAPYLATMIVLAGVVGRAIPPAADGQPYEKQ